MSRVLNYIVEKLKERQKAGLKKYGVSIDDGYPPTGCFQLEVIEETADDLQYMALECMKMEEEITGVLWIELKERVGRSLVAFIKI